MWLLRQLFRLVLASPWAQRSMVVAAGGAGVIGEQAGIAARLFTTETCMSGTRTGAVATTAATPVTVRLAIPAIALPATPVTDPAIRVIVHREAIPDTVARQPPRFPHLQTRATAPAVEGAECLLRVRRILETGQAIIRARGPAAERLPLSQSIPEPDQAKPRPRAPVRTRLAAISAHRHPMLLLLNRRGPTLCLVRAAGARKVHAGAKVWVAAAVGEARLVSSPRPRKFL